MIKRQAKIDALNIAIALIRLEIDEPSGMQEHYTLDEQRKVLDYLEWIMRDLENKRDEAAYRQYLIDDRKAQRLEFLKRG